MTLSIYYLPQSKQLLRDRVKGHFPHTTCTGPSPINTLLRQGQRSLSTHYWPQSISLYGDRVKGHSPHTTGLHTYHRMGTGSKVTLHILLAPVYTTVWRQGQRSLSTYYWPPYIPPNGDRIKGHSPHTTGPCSHHCMETGSKVTLHLLLAPVHIGVRGQSG